MNSGKQKDNLDQQIRGAAGRLEKLRQQALGSPTPPPPVLHSALEELAASLEELHVALEELSAQNEELAQARTLVEAERERYRELFAAAPDPYVVTTPDGTIREVNEAAGSLLQATPELLAGTPLVVLVAADDRRAFRTHLSDALATPAPMPERVLRFQPRGRAPVSVALKIAVMRDAAGQPRSVRWLLRDVTERLRQEERHRAELERSNAELQQFASVVSHDLREPLRTVKQYVTLLAERYKGRLDADADDFIGFSAAAATRMQCMIDDLLNYCRLGTSGMEIVRVDCERVVDDVLANLREAIAASGTVVTRDPLPTVLADDVQLGQVLQNLIGNAIKFRGAAPPRVHVGATRRDGAWQFAVRDNGIGIDPEHFERIFVIFQRLHGGDAGTGTGLGLAICKRIVERHGGHIWVESQPGKGSTFFFTLPEPAIVEKRSGAATLPPSVAFTSQHANRGD